MKNIEKIKKINKAIIRNDGSIDSFRKQLFNLINGEFDVTKPLILNESSLSIGYVDKIDEEYPLIMNISTFIKIQNKHFLSLELISNLNSLLENSVLAFDSLTENESVVFLTDVNHEINADPFIITCRYEKKVGYVQVNEITSFYDKRKFQKFLIKTYDADKILYKNKKTEQYFKSARLQLPLDLEYALSNDYDRPSFTKSQVEAEKRLQKRKRCFKIEVDSDGLRPSGYTVYVKDAANMQDAIEKAKNQKKFDYIDDLDQLKLVQEISEEEYRKEMEPEEEEFEL